MSKKPSKFSIQAKSKHWPGLAKLSEEMGELQQVIGKLMQVDGNAEYFDGTDLEDKFIEEFGDVYACMNYMVQKCSFVEQRIDLINARCEEKTAKYCKWREEDK